MMMNVAKMLKIHFLPNLGMMLFCQMYTFSHITTICVKYSAAGITLCTPLAQHDISSICLILLYLLIFSIFDLNVVFQGSTLWRTEMMFKSILVEAEKLDIIPLFDLSIMFTSS